MSDRVCTLRDIGCVLYVIFCLLGFAPVMKSYYVPRNYKLSLSTLIKANHLLYNLAVPPSQVNIAEVSSGFHQFWSLFISFVLVYLFLARLDSAHMRKQMQTIGSI